MTTISISTTTTNILSSSQEGIDLADFDRYAIPRVVEAIPLIFAMSNLSVVDSDASNGGRSPLAHFSPPAFLTVLHAHRLLLCTSCGTCLVRSTYGSHLTRKHHIIREAKKAILEWLATQDIQDVVEDAVPTPNSREPLINGLPVYEGYACNSASCTYMTLSQQEIRRHYTNIHRSSWKEDGATTPVLLQRFFPKHVKYFCVTAATRSDSIPSTTAQTVLETRYKDAQSIPQAPQQDADNPAHISEITPWLRVTHFHLYKASCLGSIDDFRDVLRLPRGTNDLPYALICRSVDRVLRKGLDRVENHTTNTRLHRIDAQLLNSFQTGVITQKPIQRLDRKATITSYITTFQQLVCFFFRARDDYFGHPVFRTTPTQANYSIQLLEEATRQSAKQPDTLEDTSSDEHSDTEDHRRQYQGIEKEDNDKLDELTFRFCLTLVQHKLNQSSFDSVMLAFCAILAWDSENQVWHTKLGNYSSHLSQLVYDCQLLILLKCDILVEEGSHETLSSAIEAQRDRWLQLTSRGPIGEVQSWRLYTRSVSSSTVGVAQVRWNQDGVTMGYMDITYKTHYLQQEVQYCLAIARRIFANDLCLELSNVPVYSLEKLKDNWDSTARQKSFINDFRNTDYLADAEDWLFRQIQSSPKLLELVFEHQPDGNLGVRASFAEQYEIAVQQLLDNLLSLIHKGSGQPGRRPEFLGLRWQNTSADKRNLFIHDGYVLFILNYHKFLSQSHGSRYPVRFLLPEVGELLVQYLTLIQPFRNFLCRETGIVERVSEYLWSDSRGVWVDDRMTRTLKQNSVLSLGISIHAQAWRQIAVGIAIKYFSGSNYQGDFNQAGDADDDNEGRPFAAPGEMPDVFHFQATHTPRTGNLIYGGTINFRDGLTDAGLQQYLLASQMWHQLCHHPPIPMVSDRPQTRPSGSPTPAGSASWSSTLSSSRSLAKHRPLSLSAETPLAKRLAVRRTPQRHRRSWSKEDALAVLHSLYGKNAQYRSPVQEEMIHHIISGRGEVIAALATGEGKSLAFMLPCCLPQAGTTVVVLPLVVLQQEMLRRCKELRLSFAVWDRHSGEYQHHGCPLLFVSVEAAVSKHFRALLNRLDTTEGLDRVVFDESHLVLTASDYRPKLTLTKTLRALRCQFVYLSGTLPPLLMPTFRQRLSIFRPEVVRSPYTFRIDLQYRVVYTQRDQQSSFPELALAVIQDRIGAPTCRDDPRARIIVYTLSKEMATEIAGFLGVDVYYSDSGTLDEKTAVLSRWLLGAHKVVVATSAFGVGVDYPRVTDVLHIGAPANAIEFAQEIGRLGRDGKGGRSTLVLPNDYQRTIPSDDLEAVMPLGQRVMNSYADSPRCHAAILSLFLDGSPWYCNQEHADQRCSRCRRLGLWTDGLEEVDIPLWSRAKMQRQQAIRDGVPILSDVESSPSSDSNDDNPGPELYRQQVRDEARGVERYLHRLQSLLGCCMICRLLGHSGLNTENGWHNLNECRNLRKGQFFNAKKAAVKEGQKGSGWMKPYTACYQCGNPQDICDSGTVQGSCKFRDTVYPASWAFFHMTSQFGKSIQEWTGRTFATETAWMNWLGQERALHGMRGTNAAWITDQVLEQLSSS